MQYSRPGYYIIPTL